MPMISYKQLSLTNIFSNYQEKFENDKPAFLSVLEAHIDIDKTIPISFRNHLAEPVNTLCKLSCRL